MTKDVKCVIKYLSLQKCPCTHVLALTHTHTQIHTCTHTHTHIHTCTHTHTHIHTHAQNHCSLLWTRRAGTCTPSHTRAMPERVQKVCVVARSPTSKQK